MQSLAASVDDLGHIATRRQLVALGFTGFQLTAAVRGGVLRRVRRGWYASPGATNDQILAVRVGGRLSHTSAAASYGLWPGFDQRLHLTVSRGAKSLRRHRGPQFDTPDIAKRPVVVHWLTPGRQDLTSDCTWRVGLEECLRHVASTADRETAIACLDTAMQKFRLSRRDIQRIFQGQPARARAIAAASRPGSDSGPESVVRQRLVPCGVTVRQQVRIAGVGRVDMLVGKSLVIEIDGRAYHSDPRAFENDRRRDALLVARGYRVLRFSFQQVFGDWPFVERCILAALA